MKKHLAFPRVWVKSEVFIRFTNQNIETVLIATSFARGSHTGRVAGEAVQSLTLQTFGLQARRNAVADKK